MNLIYEKYRNNAEIRAKEIYQKIILKLQDDLVKYPENTALIKWRSKYLIVKFENKEEERIILNLEIR